MILSLALNWPSFSLIGGLYGTKHYTYHLIESGN